MTDAVIALIPPSVEPDKLTAAISRLAGALPLKTVILHPPFDSTAPLPEDCLADPALRQDRTALAESFGRSFRQVFDTANKLGARGCAIITSDPSAVTVEWARLLIEPVTEKGYDLVTPCYADHPFDGIISRAIVYPLVRALYGKRVRNPMGPDFGLSNRLLARMADSARPRLHPLVSLVAESIASGMKVCEANLGERVYPSLDWSNLSPFLSQILSALFLDVERFAPQWQPARASEPVTEFGSAVAASDSTATIDTALLIKNFQAGVGSLLEIWGTVLPPSTLVELRKLAAQNAAHFRMPDETWSRIVYDFALAHRLRPAVRDRMLLSFTPLYMAWVASYAPGDSGSEPANRRTKN